jgi:acetyl-CoA acetyltransferase
MAARDPVIVGVGLSDAPRAPHLDSLGHHVQAIQRALADAGLEKRAIDGYLCAGMASGPAEAVAMAEYLGIDHRYIDGTMTGGSSFEFHVQHAAAAIRDGLCDTVLVSYGSDFLSRRGRTLGTGGFRREVSGAELYAAPGSRSRRLCMVAQRHIRV